MPEIISETDAIIAINKPAGLIVHSDGRTKERSLAQWLAEKYPSQKGVGEDWISPQGERVPLCGIVHRLDRSTSGVILAAKTQAMYEYLKLEFKARRVKKIYRAFVYGALSGEGEIVAEIMRSGTPPKKWYARPTDKNDKRAAITRWRTLRTLEDNGEPVSLLEIEPLTGRTHQIRVHLAHTEHPIVSDHLYASDRRQLLGFTQPALHAESISFQIESAWSTFSAPNPRYE